MTPQELKAIVPKLNENQWAYVRGRLMTVLHEPSLVRLMESHMREAANGQTLIPIYGQAVTPMGRRQYARLKVERLVNFQPGQMAGHDKVAVGWTRLAALIGEIGAGMAILGDGYGMKKNVASPCKKVGE